jgi:hypothetical protein
MSPSKSRLWNLFEKAERSVGVPLEGIVASKGFTDALVRFHKLSRAIGDIVARAASGRVEKVLHTAQMPTRGDVQRLSRLLVELAEEVRALAPKIEEARAERGAAAKRRKTAGGAGRKAKGASRRARKRE